MKVEDPSALLVQWFHHKTHVLSKGDESSWQDYTNYAVQSATTKRTFVATEKTNMVIKRIVFVPKLIMNYGKVCVLTFLPVYK